MSNKKNVCPFLKTTCIGCSLYRGRHIGLWLGQTQVNKSEASSEVDDSDWIASLNSFFENVSDR